MATLIDRLTELMQAMSWEHKDLVRALQQSSSVVSQWLGNGSKQIKTIGKMEAAIYLKPCGPPLPRRLPCGNAAATRATDLEQIGG